MIFSHDVIRVQPTESYLQGVAESAARCEGVSLNWRQSGRQRDTHFQADRGPNRVAGQPARADLPAFGQQLLSERGPAKGEEVGTDPGPFTNQGVVAEHLHHLTDGRWHDDCTYCFARRVQGGNGVAA